MEDKFTILEIRNYLSAQDSFGDALHFLSADNIRKYNKIEFDNIEDARFAIIRDFSFDDVTIIGDEIVVEEEWHEECKNDDDCYDMAVEHGNMIVDKFPCLEVVSCECHRHKYSITTLKIRDNGDNET